MQSNVQTVSTRLLLCKWVSRLPVPGAAVPYLSINTQVRPQIGALGAADMSGDIGGR